MVSYFCSSSYSSFVSVRYVCPFLRKHLNTQFKVSLDVNYLNVTIYRSMRRCEALWLSVVHAKQGESLTGGDAIFQSAGQLYVHI